MATVTETTIPPLAAGDKLTRDEFLRRWEAHPEIKNAELIGGMVFMPSEKDNDVSGWFWFYKTMTQR